MIGAGKLNVRIRIMRPNPVVTRNATNQIVEDFILLAEVAASRGPLQGDERYQGDQYAGRSSVLWTIRYRNDVTSKMRIVGDDGLTYDITWPREGEAPRYARREVLLIDSWARTDKAAVA